MKPLLTLKDGHLMLSTVARTRTRAITLLFSFARLFPHARELAVPYTTNKDEAEALAARLRSAFAGVAVHVARVGSALGTHAGPGAMGVVVRDA